MKFLDFEGQYTISLSDMEIFDILYICTIFSLSTVMSMVCISQLWFRTHVSEKMLEGLDYIPYENRFQLDEEVKFTEQNKENMEKKILLETTPDGVLVLRYAKEEEGFEYWADLQLDFQILNATARKYCKLFCCEELYIDKKKNYLKQKELFEKEALESSNTLDRLEVTNSVFFIPKKEEKKLKVVWQDNKFCYRGKLSESPLIEKKLVEENTISFADFKKMYKKD